MIERIKYKRMKFMPFHYQLLKTEHIFAKVSKDNRKPLQDEAFIFYAFLFHNLKLY